MTNEFQRNFIPRPLKTEVSAVEFYQRLGKTSSIMELINLNVL
jgi:hypothetical protein